MMAYPRVLLEKIATTVSRPVAVEAGEKYRTIGVKWWGEGAYERETIDGTQTSATTLSLVQKDDLIINKIWVRHGSTAVAGANVDGCVASGEFPTFELDQGCVFPQWLHWLTKTRDFWAACDLLSHGTSGKNRIRPELFLTISIPLPPLEEQHRVVARIEELAGQLAEARELRRQAAAEAEAAVGSVAMQIFHSFPEDTHKPIQVISEVKSGIQKSPERIPNEHPVRYLTVAHVQRNHICLDNPRYFDVHPEELERWKLLSGDVLIIEGNGSADQIGRTALFCGEIDPCVHQNHVIRIRPMREYIHPEYLNIYLNSPSGQEEVRQRAQTTSGLLGLSVGRIRNIAVPIPSLDEQRRIVDYLDTIQAQVDTLKQEQAASTAELDALLPAVLDRAFKGEL